MIKVSILLAGFALFSNPSHASICSVYENKGIAEEQNNPTDGSGRLQILESGAVQYVKAASSAKEQTSSIALTKTALTNKEKWGLFIGKPLNNFKITSWSPDGRYVVLHRFIAGNNKTGAIEIKILDVNSSKEIASLPLSFFVKGFDYVIPRSWLTDYANHRAATYAVSWNDQGEATFAGTFQIKEPSAGQIMMGYRVFTGTLKLATWDPSKGLTEIPLNLLDFTAKQ